jgi:hypothetical protein
MQEYLVEKIEILRSRMCVYLTVKIEILMSRRCVYLTEKRGYLSVTSPKDHHLIGLSLTVDLGERRYAVG